MADFLEVFVKESEEQITRLIAKSNELKSVIMASGTAMRESISAVQASSNSSGFTKSVEDAKKANVDLNNSAKAYNTTLQSQQAAQALLNATVQQYTGTMAQNAKQQQQLKTELSNVSRQIKTLASATDVYGNSLTKNTTQLTQLRQQESQLKAALSEVNLTLRQQAKEANAAAGSVDQLTAKAALAEKAFNSLSATERNSAVGMALSVETKRVNAELDEQQAKLGRSTRQVGSYTNAISKAFGSLRTLANILPGIGISGLLLVGFEAIKSIYDYVKGVDTAAIALRNMTEALSSSTYTNAIAEFNQLRTNVQLAKEGFLDKDAVTKNYNETLGKTLGLAKNLDEVEAATAGERGQAYLKYMLYKTLANTAFQKSAEAAVQAQLNLYRASTGNNETFSKQWFAGLIGGMSNIPGGGFAAQAAANSQEAKKLVDEANALENYAKDYQKKMAEIAKNFNFNAFDDTKTPKKTAQQRDNESESRRLAAEKETNRLQVEGELFRQEQIKRSAQTILEDETQSYGDRLAAQAMFEEASKEIVRINDSREIGDLIAKQETLKKQEEDYRAGRIKLSKYDYETLLKEIDNAKKAEENLNKRSEDAINQIEEEGIRRRNKLRQDENQNTIEAVVSGLKATSAFYADYYRTEEANLRKQYGNSRIYREKERELRRAVDNQIQADQLANLSEAINILRAEGIDVQKLVDAYNALASAKNKTNGNGNAFGISTETLTQLQSAFQYLQDASKSANDIFNAATERRINGINKEIDAINKRRDTLLSEAEVAQLSDEDRARKKKEINDQAAAQQAQQEERARQERTTAARREKAVAIALAAIKGILFVLNSSSIPEAIIRGALVAAQVAAIAATDIPQYAEGAGIDGRPAHKGGKALIGEGGEAELVLEPGKRPYAVNKPTLKYLNAGTRVIPESKMNEQIYASMFGILPRQGGTGKSVNTRGIEDRLDKWGRSTTDAIRSNRTVVNRDRFDPLLFRYANQ